jgi:hypothetical protein
MWWRSHGWCVGRGVHGSHLLLFAHGGPSRAGRDLETRIPTPNPDPVSNRLGGVDVLTDGDVWVVGSRQTGEAGTLTEHWDGAAWSVVQTLSQPDTFSSLDTVSVRSSDDAAYP